MELSRTTRSATAFIAMSIALCGSNMSYADASWISVVDPNSSDSATNPGYPSNQSPPTVGLYVQDLLGLASAPNLRSQNDNYSGAALSGLGNPVSGSAFILAFHFGNGNNYWPHTGNFDVVFACATGCDSFTLPNSVGVSNYRLYDATYGPWAGSTGGSTPPILTIPPSVPEPGSLVLLATGLLVFASSLRRNAKVARSEVVVANA